MAGVEYSTAGSCFERHDGCSGLVIRVHYYKTIYVYLQAGDDVPQEASLVSIRVKTGATSAHTVVSAAAETPSLHRQYALRSKLISIPIPITIVLTSTL